MRNRLLALSALLLFFAASTNAQVRSCASMDVLERQLQENPLLQQVRDQIEQQTQEFIQNGGVEDRVVVTIPVVVHVVWNTASQNISDAQIQTQLSVLNADFRKLNADIGLLPSAFAGLAADCEVNFCLATQTATGAATTGIVRRQTTVTSFSDNDAVKFTAQGGSDAWDRNKYLNLWVCNLGGGILGYAQFPGGSASTDGVVCTYTAFGTTGTAQAPFNKGRTATHEVGHWLNLRHIWGDDGTSCTGSDLVTDTPNQADENYGCPAFPAVSCSNGPNGDLFMNYMDYTDDACMFMFTTGQKNRMQALFATGGARASLLSSTGCQPPTGGGTCGTPTGLASSNIAQTSATVSWGAVSGATSYTLQYKTAAASTWTTVSSLTSTSYGLTGLTAGTTYNFQVRATCSGTTGSYSSVASFTTQTSGGGGSCTNSYEPNNSFSAATTTMSLNTPFQSLIGTSTDKDYYRFQVTSTLRNIKVELTTLPYDYDVRLYRGTTTLVGLSENAGTQSEQIIYNNASTSYYYYVYVYGYNGAYSSTQCYTLTITRSSTAFRTDGSTDETVEEVELPVVFEAAAFGLFPNPAQDEVTVEIPLENEAQVQVALVDVAGKVVAAQSQQLGKAANRVRFDTSMLSNGVYFVQVRNGEQSATRKLVIQK
jgi:hypothetical protein